MSNHIFVGQNIMKVIEDYEFDGILPEKAKKELELRLEIALIEWLETYEINDQIKQTSVSIQWKVSE